MLGPAHKIVGLHVEKDWDHKSEKRSTVLKDGHKGRKVTRPPRGGRRRGETSCQRFVYGGKTNAGEIQTPPPLAINKKGGRVRRGEGAGCARGGALRDRSKNEP